MLLRKDFTSNEEAVDYLSRRRARILPVLVLMFVMLQLDLANTIAQSGALDPERAIAWLLMSVALLALVSGGGLEGLIRPELRPFLHDELTRSHRREAQAFGFWAVTIAAFGLLLLNAWTRLTSLQCVHLLISMGVVSASLRYAWLERRALK